MINAAANLLGKHMGDVPVPTSNFANPSIDSEKYADPNGEKMLCLTWQSQNKVEMKKVLKPKLIDSNDAIVKVIGTTVCGSDLHLLHGAIPEMRKGDILGHEYMGIIEQVGSEVKNVKIGDRVVASFNIACGFCYMCKKGFTSGCTQTNSSKLEEKLYGNRTVGMLGYSHVTGGHAGGQAEYVRQAYADFNLFKIPDEIPDESALFLSDVLPTSYHCVHDTGVKEGDIVGIWGCGGPIGLFAAKWALLAGASRIIGIDNVQWRLDEAQRKLGPKFEPLNFDQHKDVAARINELTSPGKNGLDRTRPSGIDVALECAAGEFAAKSLVEKIEMQVGLINDGSAILNEMILSCTPFGRIGITGIYSGFVNHLNIGAVMEKGVRLIGNGQCPANSYIQKIIDEYLLPGKIDPRELIVSNRIKLEDTAKLYKALDQRQEGLCKIFIETKFSNKPSDKAPQELTQL